MILKDQANTLKTIIRNGSVDHNILRSYYNKSIQSDRIETARMIFEHLQKSFPNDPMIKSLSIALCLKAHDFISAMTKIEAMAASGLPDSGLIDAGLEVREKVGPMTLHDSVCYHDTVTLCMIAKNEMDSIGACLHWAKKFVNEIILVDTGSTDKTKDIAKLFGARTYDFRWCNDFSAARNFGLEKANGKWILILDADEMIASSDLPAFQKLISKQDQSLKAFIIETRNYTYLTNTINWHANDGSYPQHETGLGWHPSRKVRLFPNIKDIRFKYPVHEQVEIALKEHNMPLIYCNIPVHHYGELNETKRRKKAEIYFKLGYEKLEQVGNDFQALKELATQAGQLGKWDEVIELWQRLLVMRPDYAEAYVNLSSAYWQKEQYTNALKSAEMALKEDPGLREAHYNYAISQLFSGNAMDATNRLAKLIDEHPDYMSAEFMLAVASACSGDKLNSRQQFRNLQQTQLSDTLETAVQETITRFEHCGLMSYAEAIYYDLSGLL